MIANNKTSILLLAGLLVLHTTQAKSFVLCELKLELSKTQPKEMMSIDVTMSSFIKKDFSTEQDIQNYLNDMEGLANSSVDYMKTLNISKQKEETRNIVTDNFNLRAFKGDNQKFIKNLFNFKPGNPGFKFQFDLSQKKKN
jgi:hypothetical protein